MLDYEDITPLLEKRSGIYVLFDRDEIVYIGKSLDVLIRVHTHKRDLRFGFTKAYVRWCQPHQLDRLEADMINAYQPKYNRLLYVANDRMKISLSDMIMIKAQGKPFVRRI